MTDKADPAAEEEAEGDGAEGAEGTGGGGEGAEGTEGGGQESGKKFGKKKLILFAAIGLVVLLGAGAGVYFSGLLGGTDEEHAAEGGGKKGGGQSSGQP